MIARQWISLLASERVRGLSELFCAHRKKSLDRDETNENYANGIEKS